MPRASSWVANGSLGRRGQGLRAEVINPRATPRRPANTVSCTRPRNEHAVLVFRRNQRVQLSRLLGLRFDPREPVQRLAPTPTCPPRAVSDAERPTRGWRVQPRLQPALGKGQGEAPTPFRGSDGGGPRGHGEALGNEPPTIPARNVSRLGHFRWRRPADETVEAGRGLSPGEFAPLEAANLSKAVVARATTAPLPRCTRSLHMYRTQY